MRKRSRGVIIVASEALDRLLSELAGSGDRDRRWPSNAGDWTVVGMTAAVRAAQFRRGEFATGDGRYTADQRSAGGA
jgi:hypothetical protein